MAAMPSETIRQMVIAISVLPLAILHVSVARLARAPTL
jgi:hypothetical protein